jgi:hypothetical protein
MRLRIRFIPVLIAFSVLWTALAPLTTALRESGGGMPLCHQAGMQVDAASSPLPQQPGEAPARKTHCPLCIMVFFAAFGPNAVVAPFQVTLAAPIAPQRSTPAAHRFIVGLPPGRAPPLSLLA